MRLFRRSTAAEFGNFTGDFWLLDQKSAQRTSIIHHLIGQRYQTTTTTAYKYQPLHLFLLVHPKKQQQPPPASMGLERLLLLTTLMLISTLLAAFTPYILSLSPRRLKLISTYSVGLLVGAALTVVVPEGVQAVYSSRGRMAGEEGEGPHGEEGEDMAGWIGMALLSGFVLM